MVLGCCQDLSAISVPRRVPLHGWSLLASSCLWSVGAAMAPVNDSTPHTQKSACKQTCQSKISELGCQHLRLTVHVVYRDGQACTARQHLILMLIPRQYGVLPWNHYAPQQSQAEK